MSVLSCSLTFSLNPSVISIKDEELAGRLGLNTKEVNKIMAVLEKDGLVQVCVSNSVQPPVINIWIRARQNELKDGAQRSVARQYFYLDFKHFCNVVKWRMAQMRHIIDSKLRNVRPLPFLDIALGVEIKAWNLFPLLGARQ